MPALAGRLPAPQDLKEDVIAPQECKIRQTNHREQPDADRLQRLRSQDADRDQQYQVDKGGEQEDDQSVGKGGQEPRTDASHLEFDADMFGCVDTVGI